MGVALTDLLDPQEMTIDELAHKKVAVDAFNMLYQFITSLRGPDGALLTNKDGQVTSHLIGLLSRVTKLMEKDIQLIFVFDGEAPALKKEERDRRRKLKEAAQLKMDAAEQLGDTESVQKFAKQTARLTTEMIEEAKTMLTLMGVPIVQAPSEGEAQAAYMQANGDVDYVASQDTDSILFGADKVIKNLSLLGKRKKISKLTYKTITPELISLTNVLNKNQLDREKLIILAILVGTDFAVGGIKGIGPKKGLKLIREYSDYNQLFLDVKWHEQFSHDWHEVYDLFFNMPYISEYDLEPKPIQEEALKEFLVDKHDFAKERVEKAFKTLLKRQTAKDQKGLDAFF